MKRSLHTESLKMQWLNRAVLSTFLGICFVTALTFNFQILNSQGTNPVTNLLDSFVAWFDGYGAANAMAAAAFSFCIYKLFEKRKSMRMRLHFWNVAVSSLFGFLNLCGMCMYHMDKIPFFYSKTWLFVMIPLWLSYSLMFLFAAFLAEVAFSYLAVDRRNREENANSKLLTNRPGLKVFGLIFLCWLPWIISYYPASMDWDVYRQLASFMNVSSYARSNHDPYFSSCVLGLCYSLGKGMGSENLGIFIYILLRDTALAAVYAWVVRAIAKAEMPRAFCVVVLLYYALTPVWGAYAKHAFKDTAAAGLFCAAIMSMVCVVRRKRRGILTNGDCFQFALFSCLACLFRGNVIYALLPGALLLALMLIKSRDVIRGCILLLGCICFILFNYSITHFCGIRPADREEALSLPFQMSARTVRDHFEEITDEEKAALDGYLDFESMGMKYDPLVSDPVKNKAKKDATAGEKKAYFSAWMKMIKKYPVTNFEALIASTYGYYAFTPKHGETDGNYNANMTIFNWIKPRGFLEYFGNFNYLSSMENIRDWLHRWARIWDRIPILSLTDTIAAYTWVVVLLGTWLLRHGKWLEIVPVLSVLLIILTCIASPVNDCFRYYSLAAASCPPLFLLLKSDV